MASKRAAAKLLRAGANKILKHGWVQGSYGSQKAGYCLLGSINAVELGCNNNLAGLAVQKITGKHAAEFNDKVATNKYQVIRLMRKTARALEHGLQVSL